MKKKPNLSPIDALCALFISEKCRWAQENEDVSNYEGVVIKEFEEIGLFGIKLKWMEGSLVLVSPFLSDHFKEEDTGKINSLLVALEKEINENQEKKISIKEVFRQKAFYAAKKYGLKKSNVMNFLLQTYISERTLIFPSNHSLSIINNFLETSKGKSISQVIFESSKKKKTMNKNMIFPFQQETFNELSETWLDFVASRNEDFSIAPRWSRLVVGQTGVGKSKMVKILCEEKNIPMLYLSTAFWMPIGSNNRTSDYTWQTIVEFVKNNSTGIIFVDEIDKANHKEQWSTFIRTEVFGLIDGRPPKLRDLSDQENPKDYDMSEIQEKLTNSFILIAAGAFQSTLEETWKSEIGFVMKGEDKQIDASIIGKVIDQELVNRFGAIVTIPSPTKSDYEKMIECSAKMMDAEFRKVFLSIAHTDLEAAIKSKLASRFVEVCVGKTIRKIRKSKKTNLLSQDDFRLS